MYKHILVPVDGSPLSLKAVRAAVLLAKALGARLTGFTATEDYPVSPLADYVLAHTPSQEAFSAEQERMARHRLQEVEQEAKAAGVACELHFAPHYHVYQGIIDTARAAGCDLIVMASHGHMSLGGAVLGSETNKVLTHCAIPVLVYRAHHAAPQLFRNILVPTDGSALSNGMLGDAVAFAKAVGARVTGVCVEREYPPAVYGEGMAVPIPGPEVFKAQQARWSGECLAALQSAAQAQGVEVSVHAPASNRPSQAILETAKQTECDLIFMASHGRRGMTALLLGSETNRVVSEGQLPVLVYR